jgi:hypothetical protein
VTWFVPLTWWGYSSPVTLCQPVYGKNLCLLETPPYSTLLALIRIEVCLEGTKISGHWRPSEKCDGCAKGYTYTGVPYMFPAVAALPSKLYSLSRELLWRWPLSLNFSYTETLALKPFWELKSHTSYVWSGSARFHTSAVFINILCCVSKYPVISNLALYFNLSHWHKRNKVTDVTSVHAC